MEIGEIKVIDTKRRTILDNIKKVEKLEGKYEAYQYYLDAVKREIFEETGISEVKFIDDFHINIYYYYTRNSKKIHKEVSVYLAKSNTKSVKLSFIY